MKKAVKVMGMILVGAVVGAVAGNLLGRVGVEAPVAAASVMAIAAGIYSCKNKLNKKSSINAVIAE